MCNRRSARKKTNIRDNGTNETATKSNVDDEPDQGCFSSLKRACRKIKKSFKKIVDRLKTKKKTPIPEEAPPEQSLLNSTVTGSENSVTAEESQIPLPPIEPDDNVGVMIMQENLLGEGKYVLLTNTDEEDSDHYEIDEQQQSPDHTTDMLSTIRESYYENNSVEQLSLENVSLLLPAIMVIYHRVTVSPASPDETTPD